MDRIVISTWIVDSDLFWDGQIYGVSSSFNLNGFPDVSLVTLPSRFPLHIPMSMSCTGNHCVLHGYMSEQIRGLFSGGDKFCRKTFGNIVLLIRISKLVELFYKKMVFDSVLFWDGFGTFRDIYKTENVN